MKESVRKLKLLMYKNLIVRERHWKVVLFVEIGMPIFLILFGLTPRLVTEAQPVIVNNNTYYSPELQGDLEGYRYDLEIRYTPSNRLTDRIMHITRKCMNLQSSQVQGSMSEANMLDEFTRSQTDKRYTKRLGVVFSGFDKSPMSRDAPPPKNFQYKVWLSNKLPSDLYAEEENGGESTYTMRRVSGFTLMQICLDEAYIKIVAPAQKVTMSIQQMPYPPYLKIDDATGYIVKIFNEFASLAFLVVLCVEVTFLANEKYIGINILMSVNGVKNRQNLASWLISGALFSILYLVPIVFVLKFHRTSYSTAYLTHGSGIIVWIVLTIHVCHVLAFGMHVTAYLWKPARGIFATFVVIVLMDIINNFAINRSNGRLFIYLGVLGPNFLLSRIFDEINAYEARLIGVQWSNMFNVGNTSAPAESCIGVLTILSLFGIALHFFMALYVYAVRPGKYGVAKNPLFCLPRKRKRGGGVEDTGAGEDTRTSSDNMNLNGGDKREFENVGEGTLTPGIQIRGLKKAYTIDLFRRTKVHALKGINVDFYKGEITALLGHNGAGKTTMMSILSGLTSSSEGTVFIDGKNVQQELDDVCRNIGLCPQENMVFPDLNLYEHVLFFGMLKAKDKPRSELVEQVEVLLRKMNLIEKKNSLPKELSGGQQRRMCLAMAVIGDASVLILDEPTSGMDAESKREVWDMILKMRGEKTILISTHDMEEADILGDRIAIIHSGKMRSYGTSMFLKKLHGEGQVEVTLSIEPSCDPLRIISEIGLNAQLLNQDDGKAVVAIPLADNLPEALDKLEAQKKQLGITGLSVSVITLEQVFLKVTREEGDDTDSNHEPAKPFVKVVGFPYLMQTCFAYLVKKSAFTLKNPWTSLTSTILPCLSVLLVILGHGGFSDVKGPRGPIVVSLDAYSGARSFSFANQPIYGQMYEKSAKDFGATSEYIGSNNSLTEALLEVASNDLNSYRNKYIVSGEFNDTEDGLRANGFYSGSGMLAIPATINMLSNAIVKAAKHDDGYKISLSVQELSDISSTTPRYPADIVLVTLALAVFLSPAVALYVTQPLQENSASVKQLQLMTGASSFSYWISMYLFDFVQYIISIVLLISMFVAVDAVFGTNYYRGTEIMIFFLLLFMFGLSVLPLVYLFSFWKRSMNASINILSIVPVVLGFIDCILMAMEGINSTIYKVFRPVQSCIFLLFPHISLMYGHTAFFLVVAENSDCRSRSYARANDSTYCSSSYDSCCDMKCRNGWCENPNPYFVQNRSFTSLPSSLLWMTCSVVLYWSIIFVLEHKFLFKFWTRINRTPLESNNTSNMDELVKQEENVVSSEVATWLLEDECNRNIGKENIFLAHKIGKRYGNLEVVKGISFRVKQGECFGLLGVNGAGKSTTFRMLTGAEIPNSGKMFLKEYSLATDRTRYLAEMGYCPQQDAIIDNLNAYDHLYLFARLRGIPEEEVKAAVQKWIHKLNLKRCAGQPSGTYSGGNKRRLNIAMALIGNPSLVLMDEPTTGVDPAARRSLWTTVKMCQEGGQSIILTSHSMEECEALCNRLVIMVKGQLVCIGASQELKQRFGAGYNIHVKLNPGCERTDIDNIKRRIQSTLVCKLSDENTGFIGYHVTDPEATWTIMYTMMNDLKNTYPCIEDFAVLSSTLEQLFIQFARAPPSSDDTNVGQSRKKLLWWRKTTPGPSNV